MINICCGAARQSSFAVNIRGGTASASPALRMITHVVDDHPSPRQRHCPARRWICIHADIEIRDVKGNTVSRRKRIRLSDEHISRP
jgi:hypothetical protein